MKNSALIFWLALMILLPMAYVGYLAWQRLATTPAEASSIADDAQLAEAGAKERMEIAGGGLAAAPFKLTAQTGKPFDSKEMLGKVWVASGFFRELPGRLL